MPVTPEAIRAIVISCVRTYATAFERRHIKERLDPNGTLNMKIHNTFISEISPELKYYTALSRSLDSSLGSMIEKKLALKISALSYKVTEHVEGVIYYNQTQLIADILEKYKSRKLSPQVSHYMELRRRDNKSNRNSKRHESDYYIYDSESDTHYLMELKIGGDLDNKKARSEKEALLEQYAILSNQLVDAANIKILFATAYNRYGDGRPWRQERVRQFFADEELLIGREFWNFVAKREDGYDLVMDAYREVLPALRTALDNIRGTTFERTNGE